MALLETYLTFKGNCAEALRFYERTLGGKIEMMMTFAEAPDADGVRISPGELGLTRRQSDVLRLLVQGKPNKLICRDLQLSEGTVKVHVSAILKALRVHTRAQAVAELARRGISVETLAAHRGAAH